MGIKKMLWTMVFRSLVKNARISAWTLTTLAACAALVTLFTTAALEVRSKMNRELRSLGANAVAYPKSAEAFFDWKKFEAVCGKRGIISAKFNARVELIDQKPIAVVETDPWTLEKLTPYWIVNGKRGFEKGECLAGRRAAEALKWRIGQTLRAGDETFNLVGILQTGDEDEDRIFVKESGRAPNFSYALLSVPGAEKVILELQDEETGLKIKPIYQIVHGEKEVLDKIKALFLSSLAGVLALTVLGVSASMLARVVERRKEFALLQALGAKNSDVAGFILLESATVGVLGAAAGFFAGTIFAEIMTKRVFHVSVMPNAAALFLAVLTTTLVSVLAGAVSCGRMLSLQPASALRGE